MEACCSQEEQFYASTIKSWQGFVSTLLSGVNTTVQDRRNGAFSIWNHQCVYWDAEAFHLLNTMNLNSFNKQNVKGLTSF